MVFEVYVELTEMYEDEASDEYGENGLYLIDKQYSSDA
jgi:hypothetical protein